MKNKGMKEEKLSQGLREMAFFFLSMTEEFL